MSTRRLPGLLASLAFLALRGTRRLALTSRRDSRFVKILLDENFPLPRCRRLRTAGYEAAHIIVLGQRGLPTP